MNTGPMAGAHMRAVTISREYGSGGGEVAGRLAKRLGWRLIDHEVVVRVAQELGVSEEEAQAHDEQSEGMLSRILSSMQGVDPGFLAVPPPLLIDTQAYHKAAQRVVETVAEAGHVVIVGRGAQMILAARRDVLHARIVAPLDMRIAYVMRREGFDQASARRRIQSKERDRIRYLQDRYNRHPEDPHLYDLIVNTAILDLDSAVELILLAMASKSKRLSTPTGDLGPGAGLPRYMQQPGDFLPQEQAQ